MWQSLFENTPFFVLGTFRCGSSAVARVMHEQMGILMFLRETPPDEFNPNGYFEDKNVTDMNEGHITKANSAQDIISFLNDYKRKVIKYKQPWGLKDARINFLGPIYKYVFPRANVIALHRDPDDTAKSLHKKYGWGQTMILNHLLVAILYRDMVWKDNIWATLDMTEKRTDDEIKTAILERTMEI